MRQVLADGEVDAAEYQDARQHVDQCLQDAGITARYAQDAYGQWVIASDGAVSPAAQQQQNACLEQWMGPIDQLYWAQYVNPSNQNWNDLVAACLVRKGLVAPGFTGRDYASLISQNAVTGDTSTMPPDASGSYTYSTTTTTEVPVLPGGVSMDQADAARCAVLPLQ